MTAQATLTASQVHPRLLLHQLISGAGITQAIYVAAKLKLADQLVQGPRTVDDLAMAVAAQPQPLYRLLRMLASLGVFVETEPQVFACTPIADYLQSDHPESLYALTLMINEIDWLPMHAALHSVQTGQSAFEHVHGMPIYAFMQAHPQVDQLFNAAMQSISSSTVHAVLDAYSFADYTSVLDVGGGCGTLLTSILQAYPHLSGTIMELPVVQHAAENFIRTQSLQDRCAFLGGDFFQALPSSMDVYILASVLHNWNDTDCLRILHTCCQAMDAASRLLVVEMLLPDQPNTPAFSSLLDFEMLVCFGGQERTQSEYAQLLNNAGLRLNAVLPTQSPFFILEAVTIE